mgnify:CR=1 FL=1
MGTAAHQPKGRLIPAPGGKHGKRTLGGRFPLAEQQRVEQTSKQSEPATTRQASRAGARHAPLTCRTGGTSSGHQAGTSVHELRWQQIPPQKNEPTRLPASKQELQSRHHAGTAAHRSKRQQTQTLSTQWTAGRQSGGHRRPPAERAVNPSARRQAWQTDTRQAPPPSGRSGGRSSHQASMASGHRAGTTDHELKWQQIQPPKKQAKHS